jgi:hypothetical protein
MSYADPGREKPVYRLRFARKYEDISFELTLSAHFE